MGGEGGWGVDDGRWRGGFNNGGWEWDMKVGDGGEERERRGREIKQREGPWMGIC